MKFGGKETMIFSPSTFMRVMNRTRYHLLAFATEVNVALVGDLAKLIMHRFVARRMQRDFRWSCAKNLQFGMTEQYERWSFVAAVRLNFEPPRTRVLRFAMG
jgi:hypothetical protein